MNEWLRRLLAPDDPGGGGGGDPGGGGGDPGGGGGDPGGGGGDAAASFRASIPEAHRDNPALADITSMDGLVSSYLHAQGMVGADTVRLPGKDAKPEDVAKFYGKLGRPDEAKGYEVPTEGMPADFKPDDKRLDHFRALAHKANLTKTQFAMLMRGDTEYNAQLGREMAAELEQERADADKALRAEFGDAYDEKIALATEFVKSSAPPEVATWLNETGAGNHVAFIKWMAKIAGDLDADEIRGRGSGRSFTMSPDEAKGEIARLKTDEEFQKAYGDRNAAGHKEAVRKMQELFKLAHPD